MYQINIGYFRITCEFLITVKFEMCNYNSLIILMLIRISIYFIHTDACLDWHE